MQLPPQARLSVPLDTIVFRGPPARCREYGLVLAAAGVDYEIVPGPEGGQLLVAEDDLRRAYEELGRYSLEQQVQPAPAPYPQARPGALHGAALYIVTLLFVGYAAGLGLFHADWFAAGAVDASAEARFQIWRWITALTLHADAQHLLGNVLSGLVAGLAAARLIGPCSTWLLALLAAAAANGIEMAISPPLHRAIGASTAVFALLGIISGLAFAETVKSRERRYRRWSPVVAGAVLLALFGGGGADPQHLEAAAHVDVLGHLLGFACGVLAGTLFGRRASAAATTRGAQLLQGAGALMLVALAWSCALLHG